MKNKWQIWGSGLSLRFGFGYRAQQLAIGVKVWELGFCGWRFWAQGLGGLGCLVVEGVGCRAWRLGFRF